MTPESVIEALLPVIARFIEDRIESAAGRRLAEELLRDKLELRAKAQALLDERHRR